jgi:cytochrome c551/c552
MLLLLTAVIAAGSLVLMGQAKPKAFLPGITATDEHPNGCVDCHKNQGEGKDYRLNVSLAKLPGHPKIDAMVKQLPEGCMMCHREGGKVSALNLMLHKAHYAKPADNPFVQFYQGACLNCHKLDPASGKMTVKSAAKNW